jgi:hypothetical protein
MQVRTISLLLLGMALSHTAFPARGEKPQLPLHERIDAMISAGLDGPVAPMADDAEFLRRISLDLTGSIPSVITAQKFLDDTALDKHTRLINRLLDRPQYSLRMQTVFDVMLMERRPDKYLPGDEWREFLRRSFSENKPYNVLVQEILSADGSDPKLRPAAKFFLDRNGETTLLTRDVGRIFFGIDLQCAQCHDHPVIKDYHQADYYGLNAFLSRSSVYKFKDNDYNANSGTVTFPPGSTEQVILIDIKGDKIDEPDETFVVKLADAQGAVIADGLGIGTILDDDGEKLPPKQSTVSTAEQQSVAVTPDKDDRRIRISINDWKLLERNTGTDGLPFTVTLSRPSKNPVTVKFATVNHSANDGRDKPVTISERATGDVTFKSVFDSDTTRNAVLRIPGGMTINEPKFEKEQEYLVKPSRNERSVPRFSRRQALAQLASNGRNRMFNRNIVNRLWAMMMGRGLVHPVDFHHSENPPSHPKLLDMLADDFVQSGFDVKRFLRELALSQTYQRSTQPRAKSTKQQDAVERYAVGLLKPLSGEQLAHSVLAATGATTVSRNVVAKRIKADPNFFAMLQCDADRQRMYTDAVELAVNADLKKEVDQFVKVFPGSGHQEFQATAQQALFLSNGSLMRQLLMPATGNLTDRLSQIDESDQLAEELYLSVLTRRPSAEETTQVTLYLKRSQSERESTVQELIWALLTSLEFRFNH